MKNLEPNIKSIFNINSEKEFKNLALDIFRFQANNNAIYKKFISLLNLNIDNVKKIEEIPYLPISFFKTEKVLVEEAHQKVFKSSGTTGQIRSQHFVKSLQVYKDSFVNGFNHFYDNYKDYTFLALLPSYIEQGDSSLTYMIDYFINNTKEKLSSFYLNNHEDLSEKIDELEKKNEKYILFGVSYALLDFKDNFPKKIKSGLIMETGGMKGRRTELTKKDLHSELKLGFGVEEIHSEYGMTEMLSQAYSNKKGLYKCPPWMKILIRNTTDPFQISSDPTKGLINIIDLANLYSCSFIATDDIGRIESDYNFSVLGRFDTSEIRGCNLMVD